MTIRQWHLTMDAQAAGQRGSIAIDEIYFLVGNTLGRIHQMSAPDRVTDTALTARLALRLAERLAAVERSGQLLTRPATGSTSLG